MGTQRVGSPSINFLYDWLYREVQCLQVNRRRDIDRERERGGGGYQSMNYWPLLRVHDGRRGYTIAQRGDNIFYLISKRQFISKYQTIAKYFIEKRVYRRKDICFAVLRETLLVILLSLLKDGRCSITRASISVLIST